LLVNVDSKNHSTTFRRALAEFERKVKEEGFNEREGRLCIEHLWRWLHGYIRPQPTEEELQAERDRCSEKERARKRAKAHELFLELRDGFTLVIPTADGETSISIPAVDESVDNEWPDVIDG